VPVLVGAATLAVAIGGAVTTANTSLASHQNPFAAPNAMSGAFGTGSLGGSRPETVSRDSDRQTLQGATGTQLVSEAERVSAQRNSALGALAKDAEKKAQQIAANRWVLPITAGDYHLTARFGQCSGLWASCHTGLDFACPTGTPIHAIADGVINSAQYDGSYGNKTVETLADGTEIWYAHQTAFNVQPGEHVVQGQVIGYVGSTGNTTGPHVHIEVRPGGGDPVDPDPAFVQHGISPDANQ
jgi:murein DD-endopeptidase MepM/ murein hydrolase activator NlpD